MEVKKRTGRRIMQDGYMREKRKLEKLAGAAALVAQEYERTGQPGLAEAAAVLFAMIGEQMKAVDLELDKLIERAGI
jgi:hypothetical protein